MKKQFSLSALHCVDCCRRRAEGDAFPDIFNKMVPMSPQHGLSCSGGIPRYRRPLFNDFRRVRNFSSFLHPSPHPATFFNFLKTRSKSAQNTSKSSKSPSFLKKMGGTEISWQPASPVCTKHQKLFKRVIEVEKSEKIIKIEPETAEVSKKHSKNDLKQSKFGDFKIGSKF